MRPASSALAPYAWRGLAVLAIFALLLPPTLGLAARASVCTGSVCKKHGADYLLHAAQLCASDAVEIRKAACLRKCAKGVFVTPGKRSVGVIADPASDPAARPAGQLEAADAAAAYLAELGGLDDSRLAALRERLGAGVALLDVAADGLEAIT